MWVAIIIPLPLKNIPITLGEVVLKPLNTVIEIGLNLSYELSSMLSLASGMSLGWSCPIPV